MRVLPLQLQLQLQASRPLACGCNVRAAVRLGHDGDDGDARGGADGLGAQAREQGGPGLFGDSCDDVYELGGLGESVAGRGLGKGGGGCEGGGFEVELFFFASRQRLIEKAKKTLSLTSCFSAFRFTSFPASSSAVSSCTISAIAACLACFVFLR